MEQLRGLWVRISGADASKAAKSLLSDLRGTKDKKEKALQDSRGMKEQIDLRNALRRITVHSMTLEFFVEYARDEDEYVLDFQEASYLGLIKANNDYQDDE